MSTLISEVMEQILEEGGILNTHAEREARKILKRNKRQKLMNRQFRDCEEVA